MKIRDLIDANAPSPIYDAEVIGITHIPDECRDGYIFFDLPHTDGRMRRAAKLRCRPLAVICERDSEYNSRAYQIIITDDARAAYSLAWYRFSRFTKDGITLVGVTGTCGKTTTATLIYKMAIKQGLRCGFIGTGKILLDGERLTPDTYQMTTPDANLLYPMLRKMKDGGARLIVMEASSHALYLKKLFPLSFDIGIFTNLAPEHLDLHKNMEDYYQAKRMLIEKSTLGIISLSCPYGKRLYSEFREKSLCVGKGSEHDMGFIDFCQDGFDGSSFTMTQGNLREAVRTSLLGEYNTHNILLATSAALALGLDKNCALATLKDVQIDGRLKVIRRAGICVIKDFAHTPDALEKLLNLVNSIQISRQNVTLVFGCGGERDKSKRQKSLEIAQSLASRVIVTQDNPRGEGRGAILFDMLKGARYDDLSIILDREYAIRYAIDTAVSGEVVIIAGKGDEKYIIENGKLSYFPEDEIIEDALSAREGKR